MATNKFIEECKKGAYNNRLGKVTFGENEINQSDYLSSLTIKQSNYVNNTFIGSVYSGSVDVSTLDTYTNLKGGETILPSVGVKYIDEEDHDYIDFKEYTLESPNENQTSSSTSFTGYDKLVNSDIKYECGITSFPCTIKEFYLDALSQINIEPESETFTNSFIPVEGNPFINNETVREVLNSIGKVACSFSIINENNKHEFRWFTSEIQYEFTTSDYSTLDGGNIVYGPINRVIIGDKSIDGNYYTKQDSESVEEIGVNEIFIDERNFLFNDTLRAMAMTAIWSKLHNFSYTGYELTTYYGKPFLKVGDKVKINKNDGTYFESYVMSNEFSYNGSFTSKISAEALTKEERVYKNNVEENSTLKRVELTVNKQNNTISSIVEDIGDREGKQTSITQDISTLQSQVSNTVGLTEEKETTTGTITFVNEISEMCPVDLIVHPTEEDFGLLYPSNNLYPSYNRYLRSNKIVFENVNNSALSVAYTLPVDLLIYNGVYDQFELHYNSGEDTKECKIIKRIDYDKDGNKYKLDKEKIIELDFPEIELKQGYYKIYVSASDKSYIKAKLMIKSDFSNLLANKVETNSKIEQTESSITQTVNREVTRLDGDIENVEGQIELKIDKDDNDQIVSMINASADVIDLKSNRFKLQSKNLTITEDGTINAINGEFNGTITSTRGEIGGWTLANDCLMKNEWVIKPNGYTNIYTMADIFVVQLIVLGTIPMPASGTPLFDHYDLNNDGIIDVRDMLRIQKMILGDA